MSRKTVTNDLRGMDFVAVFADCPHNGVLEPHLYQLRANMHKTTLKKKHESSWLMVLISLNVNHYPGCSYASFLQNNTKKYSNVWKKNIALATWKTAFSKVMCLRRALLSFCNILRSPFLCRHTTLLPTRLRSRLHSGFIAYSLIIDIKSRTVKHQTINLVPSILSF